MDQLQDQLVDQLSLGSFLFILARNYNGFLVDMDFFRSRESSFEQGITMVFFTTRCRMLESRYKNKGLVNYG